MLHTGYILSIYQPSACDIDRHIDAATVEVTTAKTMDSVEHLGCIRLL